MHGRGSRRVAVGRRYVAIPFVSRGVRDAAHRVAGRPSSAHTGGSPITVVARLDRRRPGPLTAVKGSHSVCPQRGTTAEAAVFAHASERRGSARAEVASGMPKRPSRRSAPRVRGQKWPRGRRNVPRLRRRGRAWAEVASGTPERSTPPSTRTAPGRNGTRDTETSHASAGPGQSWAEMASGMPEHPARSIGLGTRGQFWRARASAVQDRRIGAPLQPKEDDLYSRAGPPGAASRPIGATRTKTSLARRPRRPAIALRPGPRPSTIPRWREFEHTKWARTHCHAARRRRQSQQRHPPHTDAHNDHRCLTADAGRATPRTPRGTTAQRSPTVSRRCRPPTSTPDCSFSPARTVTRPRANVRSPRFLARVSMGHAGWCSGSRALQPTRRDPPGERRGCGGPRRLPPPTR